MGKSRYLLIFFLAFSLITCKTSQDLEQLKTELYLTITDEQGNLLNGAVVAIFNNEATYSEKSPSYSTEGAIAVDSSKNGICSFIGLSSNDTYRVSVHYKDKTTYPGGIIDYDNSEQNNTIKSKLFPGSVSKATIKLKSANGLVLFYTLAENKGKLPMIVKLSDKQTGTISKAFTDEPTLLSDSVTIMKIRNNKLSFNIFSNSGCFAYDSLKVEPGELKKVLFKACNTGRATFWAGVALNSSLPITIILNNNDTLGVLNSVLSTAPSNCSTSGSVYADYLPGDYAYTAVSPSSKLVWTGTVTLSKDDCKPIEIK